MSKCAVLVKLINVRNTATLNARPIASVSVCIENVSVSFSFALFTICFINSLEYCCHRAATIRHTSDEVDRPS